MKNTAKVSHDTMLRELENLATCLESFRIVLADYSHSNDHFEVLGHHVDSFIMAIPLLMKMVRREEVKRREVE